MNHRVLLNIFTFWISHDCRRSEYISIWWKLVHQIQQRRCDFSMVFRGLDDKSIGSSDLIIEAQQGVWRCFIFCVILNWFYHLIQFQLFGICHQKVRLEFGWNPIYFLPKIVRVIFRSSTSLFISGATRSALRGSRTVPRNKIKCRVAVVAITIFVIFFLKQKVKSNWL